MGLWTAFALVAISVCAQGQELRFREDAGAGFSFDTGVLSGKLHADGKSVGLLPVVHTGTGTVLTSSMGFAGHYRVFTTGRRFGTGAWYWPSTATLLDDGAVEAHWPAAEDRPFELRAVYRWADASTLDVETRVMAKTELTDFEMFVAWYFSEGFTTALVPVRDEEGRAKFVPAEQSQGVWQMFPRDDHVVRLIEDGRWKLPPNPVDWVIRPAFARAMGVRRAEASGLTALMMASAEDCFAVSTPHQSEGHRSMYLSLFGRTVKPGDSAHARVRMTILPSATPDQMLRAYETFQREPTR